MIDLVKKIDKENEVIEEDRSFFDDEEEFKKDYDDLDIDWSEVSKYNQEFAHEIYNCIDKFIDKDNINESFESKGSLKYHFKKTLSSRSTEKIEKV